MRISSFNQFNSLRLLKLFQQLQPGQSNQKSAVSSKGMVEVAPGFSCVNDPVIIANFRKNFDKDGDFINSQGVAGMSIHGKDPSEWHQIIEVSEQGKDNLFNMVKSEFIENNGVLNGDTTSKSEVYTAYYNTIPKADRLKAGWTMQTLEVQYRKAFISAIKADNPNWEFGQEFDSSLLDDITRQTVEGAVSQAPKGLDTWI